MKAIVKYLLIPLLFFGLCSGESRASPQQTEMRGVWVSTVLNLDYPAAQGQSKQELAAQLDALVENTKSLGLNALFFQVRPCADSFYPSKLFPYSTYLTGQQGQSPDGAFDPLGYLVEKAHAQGIAVHAWINPYRVTQNSPGSLEQGLAQLADWHPVKQNPGLVQLYNGNLYFDPGLPEARQLILDGALEIAQNYPIDGIHLDDYFYPGQDFDDAATYAQYGAGRPLDDFRRASVDALIERLSQQLHKINPEIAFGVSPFGIWANNSALPQGSATKGNQSYFNHYADSRKWVQSGWLDYISPQIYWYSGQPEADFDILLQWWSDTVSGTNCQLYPGIAAYKALDEDAASPWYGTAELEKQLTQLGDHPTAGGYLLFRYGNLVNSQQLTQVVTKACSQTGQSPPQPIFQPASTGKLVLSRPAEAIHTPLDSFYFCGLSDPSQPLTINGQPVASRSQDGSWGVLLPLEQGVNSFTLENGGDTLTRQVLRYQPTQALGPAWPQGETYLPQGQAAQLQISGPTGGNAIAVIGSKAIPLAYENGGYQAQSPLPGGGAEQVTAYGNPLYIVQRNGFVTATFAQGGLYQIGKEVQLNYRVNTDLCDLFPQPDAAQGSWDILRTGMEGPVEQVENSYVQAKGLGYLRLEDVTLFVQTEAVPQVLPAGTGMEGENLTINFSADRPLAASCRFENGSFEVRFPGAVSKFPLSGPEFATTGSQIDDGSLVYRFTLKDFTSAGFYFAPTDSGAKLVIRPRAKPTAQLKGVTILLDAGHGGQQTGAYGCDPSQPEKEINLRMTKALEKKLTALGAKVDLTRSKDSTLPLRQRFESSFAAMPDLFLSLHCNSAPDNQDISTYAGITTYCSGSLAQPLAQALAQAAQDSGRGANPAVDNSLLYLCRQNHTTAILLENGYLPNPHEWNDITSDEGIDQLTDALSQAILEYYQGKNS